MTFVPGADVLKIAMNMQCKIIAFNTHISSCYASGER